MVYTPMIQQYLQIKQNYPEAILFFRMGDFYEMFFEDALEASQILEIALTARDGGQGKKVPMCGVPHHAADTYMARLIDKGRRVAICEQVEDPAQAKGLVKREVTRVVTPGTVIEEQCLKDKNNNYLAAAHIEHNVCGLAFADISTGLFKYTWFEGDNALLELSDELNRLQPAELLISSNDPGYLAGIITNHITTLVDEGFFAVDRSMQTLGNQYGSDLAGQMTGNPGIRAAGAILHYLQETQKNAFSRVSAPVYYNTCEYMRIDSSSRRNLELSMSIKDGSRWGTLIWVLDLTKTAMGGRILKTWVEQPLVSIELINQRLNAVEELVGQLVARHQIRECLKHIYDLERLSSRVIYGTANAKDMLALRNSFNLIPQLIILLGEFSATLLKDMAQSLDDVSDLYALLDQAIIQDPPISVRDGGIIKDGYHQEVDRLREARDNGKEWLARIEAQEKEKTGIKNLKIGFNKVFGYYLEVTKSNLSQVPDYYIRRQTLVNAERFITPQIKEYEELIIGAEDRLNQLEYQLFVELRLRMADQIGRVQNLARHVAALDALAALAEAAHKNNFVRPEVQCNNVLFIRDGRHPVVERVMSEGEFVPNDTDLNEQQSLILLTGPNMAGKSTYMRQVALIALMAQVGSFVPAASASIGVVDQIFTRIGAADDLAGGRSTFMVEMSECTSIVSKATSSSLIIMDEVGRGTSTYDGISIARSLVEYIHNVIKARTLFSTHYHELTDLDVMPGICNYTVFVREQNDEIIFLRKVLPGRVDRSYGIHVAKLAGLPDIIIERANKILHQLEQKWENGNEKGDNALLDKDSNDKFPDKAPIERNCFYCGLHELIQEMIKVDPMHITPLEAIQLLASWQEKWQQESNKARLRDMGISCEKTIPFGRSAKNE